MTLQLRNLIYSLIIFGRIKTTRARAKAIVGLVDRIVNKIKKGTVAGKRQVLTFLPQRPVVEKLMKEIIPKLAGRSSGYTRIIKIGGRAGDGAPMVVMEWVESETPARIATQSVAGGEEEKGAKKKVAKHVKTNKTSRY
ncbi:50S ribosomal protein L17 [Candidatus Gottesmanbacteria bacterium]|nr:50S ribosomal protein L17 [Candidatus Gottesmanbacteria bacterium]MBI5465576.1 50S ribosomal protein L17 [Candidatus Gottesmanbacteria bacterium]